MSIINQNTQEKENTPQVRSLYTKIYLMFGLIVVLTYGKILWPLIFGRMHNEGISFWTAIQDISLHAIAFVILIFGLIVGFLWAHFRYRNN